jgi:hypothetical protein
MSENWNEKIWLEAGRKVCPICGKVFYIECRTEYAYKIKHKYYCSYTCFRKAETPKPLKGTKKGRESI